MSSPAVETVPNARADADTTNNDSTNNGGTSAAKARLASSRNPLRIVIPVILVAAAAYWGYTRWSFAQAHESTDNAQVDGHIVPVVAKVGGFVTAVNTGENVHVTDRAVLVTIDEREFQVRLALAEADLAAARAAAGGKGFEGQADALVRSASSQRDVGDAQVIAARASAPRALWHAASASLPSVRA